MPANTAPLAELAAEIELSDAQVEALLARYGAECCEREVADALGISINALRIRLCRATKKLRRACQDRSAAEEMHAWIRAKLDAGKELP